MKILYASNNLEKVKDICEKASALTKNLEVLSLADIKKNIEVEETGKTLLANAKLKAREVFKKTKDEYDFDVIIGEDFGFFVPSMKEVAGVYAKRWKQGTNMERANAILELFQKEPNLDRTAKFVCAMVAIDKTGKEYKQISTLSGIVGNRMADGVGFGYSMIVQDSKGTYYSDYTVKQKNKHFPRRKAFEKIINQVKGKK